jgi:hypothetical protein
MKRVIAIALLASGCFRYAPVTSLGTIDDERVVIEDGEAKRTLVHASAQGRTIEGQSSEGGERVEVDVTHARVFARRLNGPATGAILAGSAVAVAATVLGIIALVVALQSRPVPFE